MESRSTTQQKNAIITNLPKQNENGRWALRCNRRATDVRGVPTAKNASRQHAFPFVFTPATRPDG